MNDGEAVAVQIGRRPRSPVVVETRCHLGVPVVTRVPPVLDDGTPFPTTHWLTCPLASLRIARLEAAGGVRGADADIAADPSLAKRHRTAMERYERERGGLVPVDHDGPVPTGGVAGSRWGVKCLHAHYADYAAGATVGDAEARSPIGERVAHDVEPLDCLVPCVVVADGGVVRNTEWSEPR